MMKAELLKNKDFWAGVMFSAIGTAAIFIARNYRFGTAVQMGPGFFPILLGGILIVFGICIMAVGLRRNLKIEDRLSLRALLLLPLSVVLFGILMRLAGFVTAFVTLIFVSAAAGRDFKLIEVLLLAVVLTIVSVLLFIKGLGLPYPLFKGF